MTGHATAPRRAPLIGAAISAVAAGWCLLAVSPPLLEASGHRLAGAVVRLIFSPLCHQMPGRSFALAGAPLAVCARCTGMYAGFLAGCAALTLLALRRGGAAPAPPRRLVLLIAALPCSLEWLLSHAGLISGGAAGRALTGALFTCTTALYLLPGLVEVWAEVETRIRRRPPPRETTYAATS